MADLLYRPLQADDDKLGIKEVCKACFPIDYPDKWYDNVLQNRHFYTLGVFDGSLMVGMIVGQIQAIEEAEDEVGTLMESVIDKDQALYIVIFGVLEPYRRLGVGSLLMEDLLNYARGLPCTGRLNCRPPKTSLPNIDQSGSSQPTSTIIETNTETRPVSATTTNINPTIRVVYLHVESTNNTAITFYEKKHFIYFATIHGYYRFENNAAHGLVYVMYVNNGKQYQGGLKNWCRRFILPSQMVHCFIEAYEVVKGVFDPGNVNNT